MAYYFPRYVQERIEEDSKERGVFDYDESAREAGKKLAERLLKGLRKSLSGKKLEKVASV